MGRGRVIGRLPALRSHICQPCLALIAHLRSIPILASWTRQSPDWLLSSTMTRTTVLPLQCDDDHFPLLILACTQSRLTPKTTAKEG